MLLVEILKKISQNSQWKRYVYVLWLFATQKCLHPDHNYYWPFLYFQKLDCIQPLRPYESFDTLKQFLEYDRKVLRFFCLWDDSASLFGDRRELILLYFLSDDTIEIKELLPHNTGRDAMPFFLQRRKLPKVSNRHRTIFPVRLWSERL